MSKSTVKAADFNRKSNETSIPQVWGKNPIFAATKQKEPREVQIADGTIWKMGVEPPRGQITNKEYLRGFDVRHAEIIFRLLAFFRDNDIDYHHRVDLSYYKLLEIVGWERSKKSLATIKDVLSDLENIWTEIVVGDKYFKFRVLSASEEGSVTNREHPRLGFIVFDDTFLEFLGDVESFFSIRLDVFNKMSSGIAKAIYLYMPSRALKCTKEKPFKIRLVNLYEQIKVASSPHKSIRLNKLKQNKWPIMEQLNNALINYNRKLCCDVELTIDKSDYNFKAWTEEVTSDDYMFPGDEGLRSWFINGRRGKTSEFYEALKKESSLNTYELTALEFAGIDISKSKTFLLQAKKLLGEGEFSEVCGTVKEAVYSGSIKNSTAYFIATVRSRLLGELPLY